MKSKILIVIIFLLSVNIILGQPSRLGMHDLILKNDLNQQQQRLLGSSEYLQTTRVDYDRREVNTNSNNSIITRIHRLFWIEFTTVYSYHRNDFYVKYLHDYNILELSTKFGLHIPNINIEPYLFVHPSHDISPNIWNDVDWHNNFVWGAGLRRRFSIHQINNFRFRELWLEAFAEKLWIRYFPNEFFFIGHRPSNDVKAGVKFQATFATNDTGKLTQEDQLMFHYLWFEAGASLYYARSSFYIRTKRGFYLFGLSSSMGPALWLPPHIHFHLYGFLNVSYDLGHAAWNKLDWYNNFKFGVGARLRVVRFKFYQFRQIDFTISPYGELQWMRWANKVPYVPSYRPTRDWQAGIQFALSN